MNNHDEDDDCGGEMDKQVDAVLNQLDQNKDGQVDFTEFMQCAIDHQMFLNRKNIDNMFKVFDANGDGRIQVSEIKKLYSE